MIFRCGFYILSVYLYYRFTVFFGQKGGTNIETGDILSYGIAARTIDIVGIAGKRLPLDEIDRILAERKASKPLKTRTYKGVLKRYTALADSAMKGAGY